MLFRNNYGVDLGSSSVKVYSFFRNKSYIEKNMVAYRGRRILAIGNEAYETVSYTHLTLPTKA